MIHGLRPGPANVYKISRSIIGTVIRMQGLLLCFRLSSVAQGPRMSFIYYFHSKLGSVCQTEVQNQ